MLSIHDSPRRTARNAKGPDGDHREDHDDSDSKGLSRHVYGRALRTFVSRLLGKTCARIASRDTNVKGLEALHAHGTQHRVAAANDTGAVSLLCRSVVDGRTSAALYTITIV